MNGEILRVLHTDAEIAARVAELAAGIDSDYEGKNPLMIGVLKGAFIFLSDLTRAMKIPCEIDFMRASSYGSGAVSSGRVNVLEGVAAKLRGRHVIIVEDILDTGITLNALMKSMRELEPASVALCVLLDKSERRLVEVRSDYTGFVIPDEFVVGYGLDYAEHYRNLPYIGALAPEVYEQKGDAN